MKDLKATEKGDAARNEEKILKFWQENNIFQKSLEKPAPEGDFVFFEGPPTANGKPGIHHLISRAFKDIIPRYKTMRGFHVRRKSGWDTHGLPVELEVEKKLGLKSKKEIESYGVEKFNQECKKSVWEYVDLWDAFTTRMAYWLDRENPYITYEKTYMESVWNILKTVSEKKVGGLLGVGGKEMLYKDYKVLPWCPRCGTALSSHELAQGYEDVKDLSVYVKFLVNANYKDRGKEQPLYLLAWTTTPWTLPGNVALAVNPTIEYVMVDYEGSFYFAAQKRVKDLFGENVDYTDASILDLSYEPLYPYLAQKFGDKDKEAFAKAYKVYPADFVTTEDGTGIVHTAVMYGQDDFELGTKIGLPKFHLVTESGNFLPDMDFLSGRFVREKNAMAGGGGDDMLAVDIIKDLAHRGLLFKKEKYAHSYPHCWRCKTPLIYYARDSWYIRMSALRAELVAENEGINWYPEHIREGRFGEWLAEVKDWAISRERYWGTPLPIWENAEGKRTVIGSVAELKAHIPQRNKYFLMRHGESESNANGAKISCDLKGNDPLTSAGREQTKKTAKFLSDKNIDVIITSPFMRTKESAEIIADEIGFKGKIIEDERIGESRLPSWNGKLWNEFIAMFTNVKDRFEKHSDESLRDAENLNDLRTRTANFMYDVDAQYEGKNILVVSHGGSLNMIALSSMGCSVKEMIEHYTDNPFGNAEVREIDWRNLPHNDRFEIDLHKPYIDAVELVGENGEKLTRVKEVLDVWFDSGSMPFAQDHFPFAGAGEAQKDAQKLLYPADYICEAIDQTRGWFYTLHAVGALMGKGKAYRNVICLGHILDAEGKKMSKSVGNVIDPWRMMDKYGVDVLRLWMYTVNQPGDSKNFDEKTVDEVVKKVFNLLNNIVSFYEMYAGSGVQVVGNDVRASADSKNILDRWIIESLHNMVRSGTTALDEFRVFEAGRMIRDFVGDFSTWYIRRSRDRFKSDDAQDKAAALSTTKYVLRELSKYMAPFTPFYAETLYKKVGGNGGAGGELESVHLESWLDTEIPTGIGDAILIGDMNEVRALVSVGLELRTKAGIKVRQPLASVTFKSGRLEGRADFISLIADELNVKEVRFDASLEENAKLDTNISPELKAEGQAREIIRHIQDLRKKENFTVGDSVRLFVNTDEAGKKFLEKFAREISSATLLKEIVYQVVSSGGEAGAESEKLVVDDLSFTFKIERA